MYRLQVRKTSWAGALGALGLAVALSPLALSAQTGNVTGRVVAATTGQPVNGAQVSIQGTSQGSLTNSNGRYVITRVPTGTVTVQVVSVGYATQTMEVTVASGQTAVADFELQVSAVALDEIVVTGTAGAVERRKIGVSLASVDVSDITEAHAVTAEYTASASLSH